MEYRVVSVTVAVPQTGEAVVKLVGTPVSVSRFNDRIVEILCLEELVGDE